MPVMHLYKLPSGKWRVEVKVKGQRRSAVAATKGAATQVGAELILELGGSPKASTTTVADLVATWFAAKDLSITYRADANAVFDRLPVAFTRRRISDVTAVVIGGLYRQLTRDGWSPHRIGRAHAVLSSSWSLAAEYGWATSNPFTAAKRPAVPKATITPPLPGQVDALLAKAADRFGLYVLVSATIGARRGEVVGLKWTEVHDQALSVGPSLRYAPGQGVQEAKGKSGEDGHRTVAIDADLAKMLRDHRKAQVELALAAGLPSPVWVFSHDAGVTPWRPDFASREFRKLRATVPGAEKVVMKDLRHYVATQLLGANVPLSVVGKRLGHTQLKTTSDTYGKYVPAADQAAAEVMAGLRGKRSS